jgi:hypothetical protein
MTLFSFFNGVALVVVPSLWPPRHSDGSFLIFRLLYFSFFSSFLSPSENAKNR